MKCSHCPKEIDDTKTYARPFGKAGTIPTNPELDKHMRHHIRIWKKNSKIKK